MAAKKRRPRKNFWIECAPRNKRTGLKPAFKRARLKTRSRGGNAFVSAKAAEGSLKRLLKAAAKGDAKSCSIITVVPRKGRGRKLENKWKRKVVKTMGVF